MPEPVDSSDDGYTGLCSENYCTGGVGKLADESIGGESGKYIIYTVYTAAYTRDVDW